MKHLTIVLLFLALSSPAFAQTPSTPSYDDTVKWIQDHSQEAGVPGWSEQAEGFVPASETGNGMVTLTVDDQKFAIKANGCSSIQVTIASHASGVNSNPAPTDTRHPELYAPSADWTRTAIFTIPFADLRVWQDTHVPTDPMSAASKYSDVAVPGIALSWDNAQPAKWTWTEKASGFLRPFNNSMSSVTGQSSKTLIIDPTQLPPSLLERLTWTNPVIGSIRPAVHISYGMTGNDDPSHMVKALIHLQDVCKTHPDSASKDIF
jgi:hypothetical protein